MRHFFIFVLVWALTGFATSPVWERLLAQVGVDPLSFAPGAICYRFPSSNDAANFATIQSLVERRTWSIDGSSFETADKARIGNKTYSVRPPLLPALAAGVYGVLAMSGRTFSSHASDIHWWLAWMTGGLSLALGAAAVSRTVEVLNDSRALAATSILAAGIFALTTPALTYGVVVNHHGPASAALALAGLQCAKLHRGSSSDLRGAAIGFGFFAALAIAFDLAPGGIFAAVLAAWFRFGPARGKHWRMALIGAALPIAAHFALNVAIAGNFTPLLVRADAIAASGSTLQTNELSGIGRLRSPAEMASYLAGLVFSSRLDGFGPRGIALLCPTIVMALLAVVWPSKGLTAKSSAVHKTSGALNDGNDVGGENARRDLPPQTYSPLRDATAMARGFGYAWLASFMLLLGYLTWGTTNFSGTCFGVRWLVAILPGSCVVLGANIATYGGIGRFALLLAALQGAAFCWFSLLQGPWQPIRISSPFTTIAACNVVCVGLLTIVDRGLQTRKPNSSKLRLSQ